MYGNIIINLVHIGSMLLFLCEFIYSLQCSLLPDGTVLGILLICTCNQCCINFGAHFTNFDQVDQMLGCHVFENGLFILCVLIMSLCASAFKMTVIAQ